MAAPLTHLDQTHEWVAMTMTPVVRLADEGGDPVFVDTLDPERQAQTTYGCNRCFAPAVSPEAHEECSPDADD